MKLGQIAHELGVGETGMRGECDGRGALGFQPPLQVVGEQQVGQLGLAVGLDAVVLARPSCGSSKWILARIRWPTLLTVTTRDPSTGNMLSSS